MAKILLIEDDIPLSKRVDSLLKFEHHVVDVVSTGSDASHQLGVSTYDLLIVDWELPEVTGLELCRQFRFGGGNTPILMLTGKSAVSEKTAGLDAGADDYLTKPFHAEELLARVRALLRRREGYSNTVLTARNIQLDPQAYEVTKDGSHITLLPKEFALLEFFMRNPNRVFSAEFILDRVWKAEADASPQTVRTHMQRLRAKIETDGHEPLIQTIKGVGYKLQP